MLWSLGYQRKGIGASRQRSLAGFEAEAETNEPDTHVGSSCRAFSDGGSTPPASTTILALKSDTWGRLRFQVNHTRAIIRHVLVGVCDLERRDHSGLRP